MAEIAQPKPNTAELRGISFAVVHGMFILSGLGLFTFTGCILLINGFLQAPEADQDKDGFRVIGPTLGTKVHGVLSARLSSSRYPRNRKMNEEAIGDFNLRSSAVLEQKIPVT